MLQLFIHQVIWKWSESGGEVVEVQKKTLNCVQKNTETTKGKRLSTLRTSNIAVMESVDDTWHVDTRSKQIRLYQSLPASQTLVCCDSSFNNMTFSSPDSLGILNQTAQQLINVYFCWKVHTRYRSVTLLKLITPSLWFKCLMYRTEMILWTAVTAVTMLSMTAATWQ